MAKKKPSEIFEGKNSSLRKTFDEATKPTSKEVELREKLRDKFVTQCGLNDLIKKYGLIGAKVKIADFWLKELSLALVEQRRQISKHIREYMLYPKGLSKEEKRTNDLLQEIADEVKILE